MQSLVLRQKSSRVGHICRLCNRKARPGQAVLIDTVPEVRFGSGRERLFHVRCMRAAVDRAPAGMEEMDELRGRMVAAGDPYV